MSDPTGPVLGPYLRGGSPDALTLWVELDGPGTVEVLGRRARTFRVAGHHYALVDLAGLPPGTDTAYDVRVDGRRVWPPADWADPPRLRTWDRRSPYRVVVGSCRQSAPHGDPWDAAESAHPDGMGPDALLALALECEQGRRPWPDVLILGGDQVYADEAHPSTTAAVERRRGGPRPEGRPAVTSFEEYSWLYQETWRDPRFQRLLATVPSVMVFDDHDIIDDWNTSDAWRRDIGATSWWDDRVRSGLMSYWLYQHLGNIPMVEHLGDELFEAVTSADDGFELLREFAAAADRGTPGNAGRRWSYCCDAGPCRVVVIDSRNGRVLEEDRRSMLDHVEWQWLEGQLRGDVDHLVVVTSVPWLLPTALYRLEAWDEALTRGAWGRVGARVGELVRRAIDLEHWAAFGDSFRRLTDALCQVSRGERGAPPHTVTVLSGDLHFGYIADLDTGGGRPVRQVVTSPLRQESEPIERKVQRRAISRPATRLVTALLRLVPPRRQAPWRWDLTGGPWFDNNVATIEFGAPAATLCVERAVSLNGEVVLEPLFTGPLAAEETGQA